MYEVVGGARGGEAVGSEAQPRLAEGVACLCHHTVVTRTELLTDAEKRGGDGRYSCIPQGG
eukprot:6037605-Prymnesium_polylepis.4